MSDRQMFDQLDDYFHIDGPHDRERVIEAAQCAAALVRYLNHATLPGSRAERTLEWANTVHTVVGNLAAVAHGSVQLLDQLATGLERLVDDPTLYDDRRDDVHHAGDTAGNAAGALAEARAVAGKLGSTLDRVRGYTTHLGNE